MLTPDWLESCTDDLLEIYETLQTSIVEDMARRIARMGWVSESSAWQAQVLQEAGGVFEDAMARISESTGIREQELRQLFVEAGTQALRYDDDVYRDVGLNPIPVNQSPALLQVLNATLQKTNQIVSNLTLTTAINSQTAFIGALDLAHMQVASGAMSYTQAITNAVKSIADQGAWVTYPPKPGKTIGHRDRLDVAMRRATLTGVNQSAAQLQLARMDEMGGDLLEVTSHYGERPSHAEWSGQIYSRSGAHQKYPEFVASTDYGTGDGLCGWNCRHNFYPYFEGYSTPNESAAERKVRQDKSVALEGEKTSVYNATQQQRELERDIRATKRELAATNAALKDAATPEMRVDLQTQFNESSVQLKGLETQLSDLARQTHLPRQREREQVLGFGRSPAQSAVWANRRSSEYLQLIGTTASNGTSIQDIALHLGARADARGITISGIQNALTSPLHVGIVRADGSQQYIGQYATVVINATTGKMVSTWKTGAKTILRYGGA